RLHSLCTLDGMNALKPKTVQEALKDEHPGVRRHALRLSEQFMSRERKRPDEEALTKAVANFPAEPDGQVRLQLAFTLGECPDPQAPQALAKLAVAAGDDPFIRSAIMSSINGKNLEPIFRTIVEDKKGAAIKWFDALLGMATAFGQKDARNSLLKLLVEPKDGFFTTWQMTALADWLDGLEQKNSALDSETLRCLQPIIAEARIRAAAG